MANMQATVPKKIDRAEDTLFNTLTDRNKTDVDKLNVIEKFLQFLNTSPDTRAACESYNKEINSILGFLRLIKEAVERKMEPG